jgi:hypothetical protein
MGGRKSYFLKDIVSDPRRVRRQRRDLMDGIAEGDMARMVGSTAAILADSGEMLDSLAHSVAFIGQLKKQEQDRIAGVEPKQRKLMIAAKWAIYRKKQGKSYDPRTNRAVIDTVARALRGKR